MSHAARRQARPRPDTRSRQSGMHPGGDQEKIVLHESEIPARSHYVLAVARRIAQQHDRDLTCDLARRKPETSSASAAAH